MTAALRQQYLHTMGIEQWRLRDIQQIPSVACYAFQFLKNGQLVGVLLAESSAQNHKVQEMLLNIARALKLEAKGQWYSCTPDMSAVMDELRFVIMMGEFSDSFDEIVVIKTHSPECLLSQPALKAETWKDLQKIFTLLEG